jgi:hypothetical protein
MPIRVHYEDDLPAPYAPGLSLIAVYDRSNELGGMTISNAAAEVVADLALKYGIREERDGKLTRKLKARIVYRDSDGWWDELAHDGERFTGFKHIRKRTLPEVVRHLQLALRRN